MDYSLNQVTSQADCDILLDEANLELSDLDLRKRQQMKAHRTIATGSTGVEAELVATEAEITALEAAVAAMPPGPTLDEFQSKLTKLRHKKFLLEERKERYGILALVQKENLISKIEKEIAETEFYISEINRRREEL